VTQVVRYKVTLDHPGCEFCSGDNVWEFETFTPEAWDMENYPSGVLLVMGHQLPRTAHSGYFPEPVWDLWELLDGLAWCDALGEQFPGVITPVVE
jgi:hypothetical protein